MQPTSQEYQNILSEIIKKLIVLFGPTVVMAKVKNIPEISVDDDGTVTKISSEPELAYKKTVETFKNLASEAVEKIIEPIISGHPALGAAAHLEAADQQHQRIVVNSGPQAAPAENREELQVNPLPSPAMVLSAPMPAPVPLSVEISDQKDESSPLNIAGQGSI